MIVANIELLSAISPSRNKRQARIEIFNDRTGTPSVANYGYRIFDKGERLLHTGRVQGITRRQTLALDLVLICLVDARGEKLLKSNKRNGRR